jgi:hypothetical protein
VTRDSIVHASREDLIDLVLSSNERMEELEQQLRWFKQQLFGRKSERQIPEPDPSQLCLGESLAPKKDAPVATTTVRSHARHKRPEREAFHLSEVRRYAPHPPLPVARLDAVPLHLRCDRNRPGDLGGLGLGARQASQPRGDEERQQHLEDLRARRPPGAGHAPHRNRAGSDRSGPRRWRPA